MIVSPNHHPVNRTGLVGWWSYRNAGSVGAGGAWVDYSSYGNHAQLSGNAAVGKHGIDVDGVAGYATIASGTPLSTLVDITVIMDVYIRVHKNGNGGAPVFFGEMLPTALSNYWSFGTNSSGLLAFYWYSGSTNIRHSVSAIPLLTRQQIAFTFDSGSLVSFYIQGSLDNEVAVSSGISSASTPMCIGSFNNVRADAILDDIQVYNRVLSSGEIKRNFLKNMRS